MTVTKLDDPHAVLAALLARDFSAFLRKAFPVVNGGEALVWNWHLNAIAQELALIEQGQSRRLILNLPPRNLKSMTASVAWVAWLLGQDPTRNIVCVSYSVELAAKLARDCRTIMQAPWYRALFPRTILSDHRSAAIDFETTAGGGRLATSTTGTLTGRGGDIIIVDDPIKPDEAQSETTRAKINEWFSSTLASRLDDKETGVILVVMQRLHEADLSGTLLERGGWRHLSLPSIATHDQTIRLTRGHVHHRKEGDILHAAREGRETLGLQRASMGSVQFEAQYQQNPVPGVGNMIKAEWLKTYPLSFTPEGSGQLVQSWDTASKDGVHNDWSVCITACIQGAYIYLLDVFRERLPFPDLKRHAIRLARQYHIHALLIEDAASGQQLVQSLRAEQLAGMPLPIARRPEGDKISRVSGISALIEAGQLLLPQDAPWLAAFQSELLGFPNARHDDQVDALSQLLHWHRSSLYDDIQPVGSSFLFEGGR